MKLKVCGIKDKNNLMELIKLQPDYIGFIFYPSSKRYMVDTISPQDLQHVPSSIQKVGVFVDAEIQTVINLVNKYELNLVQLHGTESPEFCQALKKLVPVIKVFNLDSQFDFKNLDPYENVCDYFLFDTKTELHGGSGLRFDWNILKNIKSTKPFFLSGGINLENASETLEHHPFAIDINSKFENELGLKDIDKIKKLQSILKNNTNEVSS